MTLAAITGRTAITLAAILGGGGLLWGVHSTASTSRDHSVARLDEPLDVMRVVGELPGARDVAAEAETPTRALPWAPAMPRTGWCQPECGFFVSPV